MTRELKYPNMALSGGGGLEVFDPNPDDFDLEDIAWGLSRQCRFAGQIRRDIEFYSVAQHSVEVADWVSHYYRMQVTPNDPKTARNQLLTVLEALLHDATEAYLSDVVSPVKRTYTFEGYRGIEANLDVALRGKYGLPLRMSPLVKRADMIMLATEKRDLMKEGIATDWGELPPPRKEPVIPLGITESKELWLGLVNSIIGSIEAFDQIEEV